MAEHFFKLTVSEPVVVDLTYYAAFRARVTVTEVRGEEATPYVFIYARGDIDPHTEESCDKFCAVAGPAQLSSFPKQIPSPLVHWPYYLLNYVELDFISRVEMDNFYAELFQDVANLAVALDKIKELEEKSQHWLPYEPDNGNSDS